MIHVPKEDYLSVRRSLVGMNANVFFDSDLSGILDKESPEGTVSESELLARAETLVAHAPNLALDPKACPSTGDLSLLSDVDWEKVCENQMPLLSIWSKVRLAQVRLMEEEKERSTQKPWVRGRSIVGSSHDQIRDRAKVESLPLLHGTSYESLLESLDSGSFMGNRGLDQGGDESFTRGSTIGLDRELGLDRYVFADFGRPHKYRMTPRPEVTVVFGPEAMALPGTFMTEQDRADCLSTREYISRSSLPEDFHETALRRIRSATSDESCYDSDRRDSFYEPLTVNRFMRGADADPAFPIGATFSTWEVKLPEVPISLIDKIIFRDEAQYNDFKARYGDRYRAELVPSIKRGDSLEVFSEPERYSERYSALVQKDYNDRLTRVESAEDAKDMYVILGRISQNLGDELIMLSDPFWYSNGSRDLFESSDDVNTTIAARRIVGLNAPHSLEAENGYSISPGKPVAVAKIKYSKSMNAAVVVGLEWK